MTASNWSNYSLVGKGSEIRQREAQRCGQSFILVKGRHKALLGVGGFHRWLHQVQNSGVLETGEQWGKNAPSTYLEGPVENHQLQ